jgi:DNA modification methylase
MFESGKVRTELIWTGKRREKEPLPVLPFQYIETVNEPRTKTMDYFYDIDNTSNWYNLLIWGDNKLVMNSLLEKFAGKINLIYIDPPFATGADFSMPIRIEGEEFVKEPSAIEVKVYRDTWGQGLASYLQMMYDRLVLMRELLAETGTIYVHLDYRVVHYVKLIMDEIFGKENFINEIAWVYTGREAPAKDGFVRKHETILFYSKTENYTFNKQYEPYDEKYVKLYFVHKDEDGRLFQWQPDGKGGRYKQYLDEAKGIPLRDWWQIKPVHGMDYMKKAESEWLGFPTQKPEALLERIIKTSSNEGDIIADFFCGSGTTLAVAEKLGRRWIGCDISKYAINVTRKRLLEIPNCKPFHILNLGKYQKYMLVKNGNGGSKYLRFILQLYKATPIKGFAYLHGKKDNRLVHVGSVDSFVSVQEVKDTAREAENVNASGIDILGWDFEMGLHDLLDSIIRQYGKDIKLKIIPNTVLDIDLRKSKSTILDEIKFFDLNYLDVGYDIDGKVVKIYIKRFNIANPEFIPEEIRNNIKDFTSYIDYWAVDFDYKGDTFHNMRQEYRTRKNPKLKTSISYEYDKSGKYDILVKVVDILGNDTNKLLTVRIN